MSSKLVVGQSILVGRIRGIVIDIFDTAPPGVACEVISDSARPLLQVALLGPDGWRFLDAGKPAVEPGQLDEYIARLREQPPTST